MIKPQGCGSTDQELIAWLTLFHTPKFGPKTANKLLQRFSSAREILEYRHEISSATLRNALLQPNHQAIDADLTWLSQSGSHHIIHFAHPDYPKLLKNINDPPLVLFINGDQDCLGLPQLGIVGSRNPSATGLETAHNFALELAKSGLTINSGLAIGIDAAAHTGALHANAQTIAVIGSGLDNIYPAKNNRLAQRISQQGAVISEFSPGTLPIASNFPRRNRIISGLSVGILVIEAAYRSGSLITARLAAEQGREVFAIPGSIHNPMVRGNHRLIRSGACLVETTHDIVSELSSLLGSLVITPKPSKHPISSQNNEPFMEYIDYDPVTINTLISRSGLTAERVSAMLSSLEIQGSIVALPGGRVCRS